MASITHIKDNVDLIEMDGRSIYIIGTAHVSNSSADLVEETIREIKPDTVAIELCESRYASLQDPDRWKNTDILSVLRQGKGYVLIAQLLLAGFQKKLGGKLKVKPGAEMLRAIEIAKSHNAAITLADRDVKTTLKRTWASLSYVTMFKLLYSMVAGVFGDTTIDEKEIDRLKTADALQELMKDFTDSFPEIKRTLIEERDQYLAMKVKQAPGNKIVAVVGAGHVPGMLHWIDQEVPLASLEVIPPKSLSKRIVALTIPVAFFAMIVYGFTHLGGKASLDLMSTWFWVNACIAAIGSTIALAHPLSILAVFVSAPFIALYPLLAAGWIPAIVEAIIRKPRVSDLEALPDDITTAKGWWSNRVTKILLILAITSLFGRFGTIAGVWMVASQLH